MSTSADIVVIGAGVHGASAAFHLARAGIGKVVLLDKSAIACGPTAKSGAMVRPIFADAPYIQLVSESISMFENWSDSVGGDAGWVGCGFLRITPDLKEENVGGNLELMRQLGVRFEMLNADQLKDLIPSAHISGSESAIWLRRAGYADPVATTTTLTQAAQSLGVQIKLGVAVTGIRVGNGRIEAVETTDGPIHTRLVLNCAGPWAPRLASMVGVSLPIETHRTPTCTFLRPPTMKPGGPILSDGTQRVYLREVGDTVIRAAHFGWAPDRVDPDSYDETITSAQLGQLLSAVNSRFSSYQHGLFVGGFSAIYDMTPDGHPIIGTVGEIEGFWCNCGWSGNGFASAPAIGQHLAARIMGQKTEVDLSMFTWPRPPQTKPRPDTAWIYR